LSKVLKIAGVFLIVCVLRASDSDVLGSGHGLDHVGIAVHNLDEAEKLFRDTLGFTIGLRGRLLDGITDTDIEFKRQGQYLELIEVNDRQKASVRQGDLVRFLDKYEGPVFAALDTSSAARAAAYFRKQGLEVDGPTGNAWTLDGAKEQFPEGWLRVRLNVPNTIFFMESHNQIWKPLEKKYPVLKDDPKRQTHPNGAIALRAVWMAVKDLDAAARGYERAGLPRGRSLELPALGASATEIHARAGSILLVTPKNPGGAVAKFLDERGESVMGVSLKVADLHRTQAELARRIRRDLPMYEGPYGKSIAVPGDLAKGTWIEFF
jgi:catechol 2,3-dioxygenase-like lactoylglutathione lyase family enzyme